MTHTKKRSSRRPGKLGGAAAGRAFRDRLGTLVKEAGSQRRFAGVLWHGLLPDSKERAPRIGEWLGGDSLPGFDSLRLLAGRFDCSVDWLLGFDVPRRRTDREKVGDLAESLFQHIVRAHIERSGTRRRRDGLAHAVGGHLLERISIPRLARTEPSTPSVPTRVGTVLGGGRIVTNTSVFGLQVLETNTRNFLEHLTLGVIDAADRWETANEDLEREAVRQDAAALLPLASEIAEAESHQALAPVTTASVVERIAAVIRNPVDRLAQSDLLLMNERLKEFRTRQAEVQSEHATIAAGKAKRGRPWAPSRDFVKERPKTKSPSGGTPVAPQQKRPTRPASGVSSKHK